MQATVRVRYLTLCNLVTAVTAVNFQFDYGVQPHTSGFPP